MVTIRGRPQWRRLHSPRAPINHGGPRQASHERTNNETMGEIKHGDITLFIPYNCWRACPAKRLMEGGSVRTNSSNLCARFIFRHNTAAILNDCFVLFSKYRYFTSSTTIKTWIYKSKSIIILTPYERERRYSCALKILQNSTLYLHIKL